MSSDEFGLWLTVYEDDLWGEMQAYERTGIVAATVANYAGMMRSRSLEPAKPSDFMPIAQPTEELEEPDPMAFIQAVRAGKA